MSSIGSFDSVFQQRGCQLFILVCSSVVLSIILTESFSFPVPVRNIWTASSSIVFSFVLSVDCSRRIMCSLSVYWFLLSFITFSRRQMCLGVDFNLLSIAPLLSPVRSCWVYQFIRMIYQLIRCYLCSIICTSTISVVSFRRFLSSRGTQIWINWSSEIQKTRK